MSDVLDIILKIGGVGAVAALITTVLGKKLTPRRSPAEVHDSRVVELERARTDDRSEIDRANQSAADCRHDVRLLSDYVHDLRDHIVNGRPPPPPDFPEGLRL